MPFDLSGLLDKAKEAVENNPKVVDKVKDLAGQAEDSDATKHAQEVVDNPARDHAQRGWE